MNTSPWDLKRSFRTRISMLIKKLVGETRGQKISGGQLQDVVDKLDENKDISSKCYHLPEA